MGLLSRMYEERCSRVKCVVDTLPAESEKNDRSIYFREVERGIHRSSIQVHPRWIVINKAPQLCTEIL